MCKCNLRHISKLGIFVDRIYPIELEIKDTTDTDRSASYLYFNYISLAWLDIPELVVSIRISLIEGWSHHFESFTVATMTW